MLKYIQNHEKVIVLLLKIVTEHLQDASAKNNILQFTNSCHLGTGKSGENNLGTGKSGNTLKNWTYHLTLPKKSTVFLTIAHITVIFYWS